LLWCGRCHTPKQTRVKFLGRTDVQYCLCECEKAQLEEEEAERKRQQRLADKLRERSIRARSKRVDLVLELNDGTRGHIKGEILSRR